MATVKDKQVQARVKPKMKEAVTKKAESIDLTESEIIIKLLEKWLKGEVEI